MKNELDNKVILTAYEKIIQYGDNHEDGKLYHGIHAFSDIDGYTIYLKGSGVFLRFGFHNAYHLDYQSEKNKDDFLQKVNFIANE